MCHTVAMNAKRPGSDAATRPPWDAWAAESPALPIGARTLLSALLKSKPRGIPRRPATEVRLTPSRLDDAALGRLREIVGEEHATRDDAVRLRHLGGKSTPDLLAR